RRLPRDHRGQARRAPRAVVLHGRPDRRRCREGRGRRGRSVVAEERRRFELSLVTPEGAAYEGECEMLIVPGAAGEIGILARHAPLVAMLKAGSTRVHVHANEVLEFATGPGFFKVEQDRALALVDDAVDVRQIDRAEADRQLGEARAELERLD